MNHNGNFNQPMPSLPVALRNQLSWELLPAVECRAFSFQKTANQHITKDRCKSFIDNFRRKCSHKLRLHSLEGNEVNLFSLLLGSAFDSILEFTNESMSVHKLQLVAPSEFRLFLGTMFLSSSFNASVETMWEMMRVLSKDKCMTRERYNQIMNNLRGFDMTRRMILDVSASWNDQRNKLKNLHSLEKKVFDRSIEFFFDSMNSCVVLDDELIASKGEDVESKLLSDRKSGKEGPTTDVSRINEWSHHGLRSRLWKTILYQLTHPKEL